MTKQKAKEKALNRLKKRVFTEFNWSELESHEDIERAHIEADNALLDFLRDTGNKDIAEAFEKRSKEVGFQYS